MPAYEHRLGSCDVIASATLRGDQDRRAQGVTAVASRTGQAHIALRVGRVLMYLEDREALEALRHAVRKAERLADEVFGPVDDAIARTEAHARREFEKGRRPRALTGSRARPLPTTGGGRPPSPDLSTTSPPLPSRRRRARQPQGR